MTYGLKILNFQTPSVLYKHYIQYTQLSRSKGTSNIRPRQEARQGGEESIIEIFTFSKITSAADHRGARGSRIVFAHVPTYL